MRIHVALGDVLVMLQAKGLLERIAVRGEAEVEAVRAVILFKPARLHPRPTRNPGRTILFLGGLT
jgi:hypothetical protein